MDFSENMVEIASIRCPQNTIIHGNIVEGIPFTNKFHGIMAFTVLMHLEQEEDLRKTLHNIYLSLEDGGYFLWFDANAKNHFESPQNSDGHGFSLQQMKQYAGEAGFSLIYNKGYCRQIPFVGNSRYLAGRVPMPLVKLISSIFPSKSGNILCIFKK